MDDEAEVYKMWRVRKTVMSLCHDRGYLVSPTFSAEIILKIRVGIEFYVYSPFELLHQIMCELY